MLSRIGIVAVNLVVVAWFVLSFRHSPPSFAVYRADLDVYRLGGEMWLRGGDLYGILPNLRIGTNMPFTYPPISAVLFTPLAVVPFWMASAALAIGTIALVAVVLVVSLRALDIHPSWQLVGFLLPVALVTEPVRTNLYLGQINVVLMALVAVDCLVRTPRWPRGVLLGLAAAIKLTPAVFVLFFLLRGDRRAAVVAGLSFVCTTGVGFLLAGRDSMRFWTVAVFDTDRVGGATRAANQSIKGLLARLGVESGALWVLLCVALLALTVVAMRRAFAAGRPMLALSCNALGALPLTPVSWSHHWVWITPVLLTFGVMAWRTRDRLALGLTVGGLALFVFSPHWWWDPRHEWDAWRLLSGNLYICFAVVALCAVLRLADRELRGARVDVDHRAVA